MFRQVENRVVAKPRLAGWRSRDDTLAGAFGPAAASIWCKSDNAAAKAGLAAVGSNISKMAQQQLAAVSIVQARTAKTGRVDAGSTLEGIHFEARVVGQGNQVCRGAERRGLEDGVFCEAGPSFLGLGKVELGS